MYVELSLVAKNICETNYNTNCGQCPLRSACVTPKTVHSKEDLNAQTEAINELAEQLVSI